MLNTYMISGFAIVILKMLLVLVIMVGMVVILLGIGIAAHTTDETSPLAADELRRDVAGREDVIGRHSVFHNFLTQSHTAVSRRKLNND